MKGSATGSSSRSVGGIAPQSDAAAGGEHAAGEVPQDPTGVADGLLAGREIIYTATVRIVVGDFSAVPQKLAELARSAGGFVAETEVARMQGTQRSGRWVVRVPGTRYHEFIRAASGLGVPESVQETADDVTEQFVDLEARISSGRRLEEQIMKLLEKQDDGIENVLAVERELSRVRLEIERMEGRLRFLRDQVSFSTITVYASEQRTFIPEQALTISQRTSLEWEAAVQRFREFVDDTIVWLVANAIVIAAWIVGLGLFWMIFGRRIRRLFGLSRSRPDAPGVR